MVFYCERATGFCRDTGNDDESYFKALVRMFGQAANALPSDSREPLIARLESVCGVSHQFVYGVS
jgi:hypothetical protein